MPFRAANVTPRLLNWMKQQERNFMLGKIVARLWLTSTLSLLSSSAHSLCSTYLWLSSWTILTILLEIHPSWDLTIWENLSLFGPNMILEEGKKKWKKHIENCLIFGQNCICDFFLRKCSLFSFSLQFIRDILRYFLWILLIFLWFFLSEFVYDYCIFL